MGRTFYDVLGVEEDAGKAEIRRTYRAKAKEHHPDVSDDPDAGERFKRINRAAEVLGDPVERKRYDRLGHEAYVASDDGPGEWDPAASEETDASSGRTATAGDWGSSDGATGGPHAADGASDAGTTTAGPWGPDPTPGGGDPDAGAEQTADTGGSDDGPWTGFRDVDTPGTASAGGTIGGSAGADPEQTARWERAHEHEAGAERADAAWRDPSPRPLPNPWLLTLSTVGSGRIVDQWTAFRRGLLLVYLYPVVLTVLLAQVSPPITLGAATVVVFLALYGSGIPNVGTLVFGLLGGLITVFLVQSPYSLSSPTARVLLAACWLPLGHSVLVAWLLHRSRARP